MLTTMRDMEWLAKIRSSEPANAQMALEAFRQEIADTHGSRLIPVDLIMDIARDSLSVNFAYRDCDTDLNAWRAIAAKHGYILTTY